MARSVSPTGVRQTCRRRGAGARRTSRRSPRAHRARARSRARGGRRVGARACVAAQHDPTGRQHRARATSSSWFGRSCRRSASGACSIRCPTGAASGDSSPPTQSLAQQARSVEGEIALDGDASLGIVRALRRRRAERLDHVSPARATRGARRRPGTVGAGRRSSISPLVPCSSCRSLARGRIVGALTFGRGTRSVRCSTSGSSDWPRSSRSSSGWRSSSSASRRVAEAAARTKSEFLAMMSHELRTPLNAIAGYAQLLEMGFRGPLTDGQRDAVNRILRGQEHLLTLVDAVLTFSRLTSGRLTIDSTELDAADLIDLASEPLVMEFAAREIDFRILPCPERARVCADRERAVEILRHLLSNALKFTPTRRLGDRGMRGGRRDGAVRRRRHGPRNPGRTAGRDLPALRAGREGPHALGGRQRPGTGDRPRAGGAHGRHAHRDESGRRGIAVRAVARARAGGRRGAGLRRD